jgi:DNA mismatch repair protein MSH4
LIQKRLPDSSFATVQRKYFSESKGHVLLKSLVIPEQTSAVELEANKYVFMRACISIDLVSFSYSLISTFGHRFLCLASCAALIKYVEYIQSITYANHSLRMTFVSSERTMLLDSETIRNLELLSGTRSASISGSLFEVLNFTKTTVGRRLLRATLVQPPGDVETIQVRVTSERTSASLWWQYEYRLHLSLTKKIGSS